MKMVFVWALKEWRKYRADYVRLIIILTVGLMGPCLTRVLSLNIEGYLAEQSRALLGADVIVSSLRPITAEESAEAMRELQATQMAQEIEFLTMARAANDTAHLVQVKAIDSHYPLVGHLTWAERSAQEQNPAHVQASNAQAPAQIPQAEAWVYPEVLELLGLKVGETLKLGESSFVVRHTIAQDGPLGRTAIGIAPRVYISLAAAEATGLTSFGSQVNHRNYFLLAPGAKLSEGIDRLKAHLLHDPDLFLRTPQDSLDGFLRFTGFFTKYMQALTLLIFAMAWVAALVTLQSHLQRRLRQTALLLLFGVTIERAILFAVVQIFVAMGLALTLSLLLTGLLLPLLPLLIGAAWPAGLILKLPLRVVIEFFVIAVASSGVFALPFISQVLNLTPALLLKDEGQAMSAPSRRLLLLNFAAVAVLFILAGALIFSSFLNGAIYVFGLLALVSLGWFACLAVFKTLARLWRSTPGSLRLIWTLLSRLRLSVALNLAVLTLVSLLLNLIPGLIGSVNQELNPNREATEAPLLFAFNISEADRPRLERYLQEHQAELKFQSPLILARLTQINDRPPQQDFLLRFPVRVSYRKGLLSSESLLEGQLIESAYSAVQPSDHGKDSGQDSVGGASQVIEKTADSAAPDSEPALSLEKSFADRNGIRLGDGLHFNIQGLKYKGRVRSFRHVHWTDFQPNFFIEFQPGVLDDVPKTWIGNIMFKGASERQALELKASLARDFSQVTFLDVGQTLQQLQTITKSIAVPLIWLGWLVTAVVLLLFAFVLEQSLKARSEEFDLLELFGREAKQASQIILLEYGSLVSVAGLTGIVLAQIAVFVVCKKWLEIDPVISWTQVLVSLGVEVGLLLVWVTYFLSRRRAKITGF